MNQPLWMALLSNLILCSCELYALGSIRKKTDILKYYTYLQNLLALAAGGILSLWLLADALFGCGIPGFVRGLRYVTTCGLTATAVIYAVFLSGNSKNKLQEEDFLRLDPKTADFLLHGFCPLVSLLSFCLFERPIPLTDALWTALAPLPSCLYWAVYPVLTAAGLWDAPYDFSSPGNRRKPLLSGVLPAVLIPCIFIAISYVLWNVT